MPEREKPKGRPRAGVHEETLQVRVRKRNPLIERHDEDEAPGLDRAPTALAGAAQPSASIYDPIDENDRTDRTEPGAPTPQAEGPGGAQRTEGERSHPVARAYLDEDETVVASGPPRSAGDLAREHDPLRGKRSARSAEDEPTTGNLEVVPRQRFVGSGTDAAGAAVHRQMIDRMELALPVVRAPALKLLRAELKPSELEALDLALAGGLDPAGADGSLSPKRALEQLVHERGYHEMSPKLRALLMRPIAAAPADLTSLKSAIALLKTGVLGRLREGVELLVLEAFAALASEARARLAQLAARQLRGRSALEDRDIADGTLIDHIHALALGAEHAPLLDARRFDRGRSVSMLLSSLANPERMSLEEGSTGVAGMIEFGLAETSPAELARLWRKLVGPDLSVELPDQAALDLGACLRAEEGRAFSAKESPFHVALEGLARGAPPDARRGAYLMRGGRGLDAEVVSRSLGSLYGVGFTVAAGAQAAIRHVERVPAEPQRVPPVYVSVLYARGERMFVYDHHTEDHVFVRAPHGRSAKPAGAMRSDPDREIVDPESGLERFTVPAFKASVGVGLIPRT